MIELDFHNLDLETCSLNDDKHEWVLQIMDGAFRGSQILKVEDIDFSGEYPILGFAQWLNLIAFHLEKTGTGGFYIDPYFEKQSKTEFSRDKDSVVFSEVNWQDGTVLYSAQAPMDEFVASSKRYKNRVYNACCELFPPLCQSDEVQAWINDFSISPMSQSLEPYSAKPAKIVRLGFEE